MKRRHYLGLLMLFGLGTSITALAGSSCCPKDCYTSCCKSGCCPTNCCDPCKCEASSKTYFNVRPLYQTARAEMISGFRNERMFAREDGRGGTVDMVLFGSKSTKSQRLASYFMPGCKTTLTVAEDINTAGREVDLWGPNFNIDTTEHNFTSTFCFEMDQSVIGLGLQYKQRFCWDEEDGRGWWFSISSPITRVKNTVSMCENIDGEFTATSTGFASMCTAFNQPNWHYGRIAANTAMSKTRLADIELKIGHEWLFNEACHFGGYAGLLAPTGNTPNAGYVFEPIVGHGGHFGAMWGSDGGYRIWEHDEKDRKICMEYNIHSQYLFEKKQCRSFDLKNRPWSRYIKAYKNKEDALTSTLTPGINIFTREVKVRPRLSHNLGAAFVFTAGGFQGEVGSNIFCRQSECVKLACPWPTGDNAPALPDTDGDGINPFRKINITGNTTIDTFDVLDDRVENIADDYDKYVITECDLDLKSASHPAILTYTLHGALGYRWDEREYPIYINAGGSYEFADDINTVLNRWTVWGKFGFSF